MLFIEDVFEVIGDIAFATYASICATVEESALPVPPVAKLVIFCEPILRMPDIVSPDLLIFAEIEVELLFDSAVIADSLLPISVSLPAMDDVFANTKRFILLLSILLEGNIIKNLGSSF